MGIDNVIAGHGIGIALTGMGVVFAGLVLVSLYVALLPKAFRWASGLTAAGRAAADAAAARRAAPRMQTSDAAAIDPDLLAAIGFVVQAERERLLALDDQRITLRDDEEQRVWTAIGKMRTLSTRM